MPVSGGDIGLNVWVEKDELLIYMGRAGYRDENGALLKPGRVRVKLIPNPFENAELRQELKLREGYVLVTAKQSDGNDVSIKIWVEVHRPIIHLDIESESPVAAEAAYESWRVEDIEDVKAWKESQKWWTEFWDRSRLVINSGRGEEDAGWRIGRNYQLFRYMLASNVNGRESTQFNGDLFTFDPLYVNGRKGPGYTPDHRQWGAGLTAQNQRMMVWPLLKSGDFDMVKPGFALYLDGLPNSMARVRHYWKHDGCCFTEQTAITALPGSAMYGFDQAGGRSRPRDLEPGLQVNAAAQYIYESQLEYSWLMLRYHQFSGVDLAPCLPFIEQSVIFYDEHYRFRCKQLTGREQAENGKHLSGQHP